MMNELIGFEWEFAMWPYGDPWRAARRIFAQHFNKPETYQPWETQYTNRFLQQLLADPTNWFLHIKALTASTTLAMTYGVDIKSVNDPLVDAVEEGASLISEVAGQGSFLVDFFPVLKYIPAWFPGAQFQTLAARCRRAGARVLNVPFAASLEAMKAGNHKFSFLTAYLEDIETKRGTEEDVRFVKEVAGQVYLAGADTSKAVLSNFLLAMLAHPDVQQAAKEELDTVLRGRLPRHSDLEFLPYVTAIVLETYRWQPIMPLGVAHSNTMDDVFDGYRIPAGSFVLPNQRALLYDETAYPEPSKFRPERFIKDGKLASDVPNPMDAAFGFGRRICPGRHIAHSTITLAVASILATFDIVKQKDAQGKDIDPEVKYSAALVQQPDEFACEFKPRSQQAIDSITTLTEEW